MGRLRILDPETVPVIRRRRHRATLEALGLKCRESRRGVGRSEHRFGVRQ
jgi:hypothetical protein